MTRCCLNCGAESPHEPCDSCGFTASLSTFVFRRRLLYLTAVFLLGALVFLPVTRYYPPLELDAMMIFLGVVAAATLFLAVELDRRARHKSDLEVLRRIFRSLLPVPWLLASLVFVNGRFDTEPSAGHVTRVVGKFTMSGLTHPHRLIVVSWRPERRIERVPVDEDDYIRFRPGDTVEVRTQSGLVGIPWVYSVLRH
jgi:hypothetical protein